MSQRELADSVKIDYGYLSKIEHGKVDPPSEKIVVRISETLDLDKDELLYLAKRAPSDLTDIITEGPYIPAILRRARGLSKEDWKEIEDLIKAKKRKKK
jgi:transcriptional regulator with XRE-family HTH domain